MIRLNLNFRPDEKMVPECPRCGSMEAKISTIRGLHEALLLLWKTPLRCRRCYERYWMPRFLPAGRT